MAASFTHPLSMLLLLCLLVELVVFCNGGPMMKSVDEKKVPPAAFWPYILHPTRFQIKQHKSEEKEDYYDAVRDEDATTMPTTTSRAATNPKKAEEEEETKQLQQMMALLFANVDPVPMLTASSISTPKLATAQTIPSPRRKVPTKPASPPMRKIDAETYDDERAEAGKDDEDTDEEEEEETDKIVDREVMQQYKLVPLLDASLDSAAVREAADAEADGIQQMPAKGTVDGQTHFLVDAETGGREMPKMATIVRPVDGEAVAKRKGAAQFPKPPVAEIVRMRK